MTAINAEVATSGRAVATALGWKSSELRERVIALGETRLDIARTYIAGESALLLAGVKHRNGADPLDGAALFGYHVAAEWGVLTDPKTGLTLFNSRWSSNDGWYRLPTIPWSEIAQHADLLSSLTPAGLAAGAVTRYAEQHLRPTSVLAPVDDALVDRLDRWRDELLRFSRLDGAADALLQRVYAQMFVLRTVEDRQLDQGVPPLSSALTDSKEFSPSAWHSLLEIARSRIGDELFGQDSVSSIPAFVMAGIIEDLYSPRQIPLRGARYDFSWIDADVLGMAYEKYLASVLQPGSTSPQSELFNAGAQREVERVSVRKKKGVFYTPKFMTGYLATKAIDEYFRDGNEHEAPFVIDFACGSGAFLIAAIDRVLHHLKGQDPHRAWAKELVSSRHVVGVDIDPNAVNLARLRVWQRLLEEPDALPLPSLSHVVVVGDGLRRDTWGDLDRRYDVVLGNPPFLATSQVEYREQLEARFVTAKGRYDFSSLFVEQAINVLRPHGHLGMVVPNRFFRNSSGASLRELLTRETTLLAIVDFGTTRPFEAHAYVGCIVAERRAPTDAPAKVVNVVEVVSLDSDFVGGVLLSASPNAPNETLRAFVSRHPSGSDPWVLISERDQISRVRLEEAATRLDNIAAIAQGIKTGANDLLIFDLLSDDGTQLCEVVNGVGDRFLVERALLQPVVFGSEVRRYAEISGSKRILYPYRKGVALSEREIQTSFPNAWNYLNSYRSILGARSSLLQGGGQFFELVRPRDEAWLRRPKLLMRDLAPRTSFAVDQTGATFLVGGTAVAPEDSDLLLCLFTYLNSSFVNDYVRQSTPAFQGNYQKFEPKHLQSIPVLNVLLEDLSFQSELTDLGRAVIGAADETLAQLEQKIDAVVIAAASAVGLN